MGVFGDNFRKLLDFGLPCIPVGDDKNPIVRGFDKWADDGIDEQTADFLEREYKDTSRIGLLAGRASKTIWFDFDYSWDDKKSEKIGISKQKFIADKNAIESEIIKLLPPTPAIRLSKAGRWARGYKWTEEWGAHSNMCVDRNHIRLFDLISWHKQIIIPPSIHSTTLSENGQLSHLYYKWAGVSIEECLDDLPELDPTICQMIANKFGSKTKRDSRHDKLFDFILLQLRLGIAPEVVAKNVVEHDKKINVPTYLDDKKYNTRFTPEEYAARWIKRCVKYIDGHGQTDSFKVKKNSISSRDAFFDFFRVKLGDHRLDLLSGKCMYKTESVSPTGEVVIKWKPVLNKLKSIRSDAITLGFVKADVEDHLSSYIESLEPSLLLDIPEWDGVDRIEKIAQLAPAKNIIDVPSYHPDYNKKKNMYVDILKDICAGTFRRVYNSMEQNLSPILRGGQGIGKNTFITNVFGKPFGYYFAEINISQDMAKNYDAVDGRIICVIGEFDQTSKVQISFIKELITNASFTARRAYERSSDRYDLHHTIFSASNFSNVLKDTSGNRRYVIFDMDSINYDYVKWCDSQQLLAQFYALYKADHRMSEESRKLIDAFNQQETPEDPYDIAIEYYSHHLKKLSIGKFDDRKESLWLTNVQVADVIESTVKKYSRSVNETRLRQELHRRGLAKRSGGTKYLNLSISDTCPNEQV